MKILQDRGCKVEKLSRKKFVITYPTFSHMKEKEVSGRELIKWARAYTP
ncbi:MAG TPA: hypothetical protein PKX31_00100 [Chitinophagaceae bacterium]|nr:hypothetical protein [Chitinophagaceae bacterium]